MSSATQEGRFVKGGTPAARWLVVPALVVVLGAGLWFFGGVVAPGYWTSIVLGSAWFAIAALIVGRIGRRWPVLRTPMRATFFTVAAVCAIGFYWTSIRDDRVGEVVVSGSPASQVASSGAGGSAPGNVEVARGEFQARAHSGRGSVAVVELAAGGRKLTFTDFATANGPDLRVYLVNGPVRGDGDVDDVVDLGRLKGNIGNQQYEIPQGTDLDAYSTVVVWCRAFSVNFAQADLRPS